MDPGVTTEVTTTLYNQGPGTVRNARIQLALPDGWMAEPTGPASAPVLRGGRQIVTTWAVTAPPGTTAGVRLLNTSATWTAGKAATSADAAALVRVMPALPHGTAYLSDLDWLLAVGGHGPVEKNQDNGQTAAGDGQPLPAELRLAFLSANLSSYSLLIGGVSRGCVKASSPC